MYALLSLASSSAYLPMTGGDGPLLVTVMGLSLAGLSIALLLVLKKKGRKDTKKAAPGRQTNR